MLRVFQQPSDEDAKKRIRVSRSRAETNLGAGPSLFQGVIFMFAIDHLMAAYPWVARVTQGLSHCVLPVGVVR